MRCATFFFFDIVHAPGYSTGSLGIACINIHVFYGLGAGCSITGGYPGVEVNCGGTGSVRLDVYSCGYTSCTVPSAVTDVHFDGIIELLDNDIEQYYLIVCIDGHGMSVDKITIHISARRKI